MNLHLDLESNQLLYATEVIRQLTKCLSGFVGHVFSVVGMLRACHQEINIVKCTTAVCTIKHPEVSSLHRHSGPKDFSVK